MKTKEKAEELVKKFIDSDNMVFSFEGAKECALIAVDEILKLRKGYFDCANPMQDEKYWQEVKQEIEKL